MCGTAFHQRTTVVIIFMLRWEGVGVRVWGKAGKGDGGIPPAVCLNVDSQGIAIGSEGGGGGTGMNASGWSQLRGLW
jgi:hypothetical protein